MGVVDWRAWTAQGGGSLPTAPNPPGTPYVGNTVFPGVGPIGVGATPGAPGRADLIDGAQSFPIYANVPTYVKPVDPFAGWNSQQETLSKTMRPAIPGLTSP